MKFETKNARTLALSCTLASILMACGSGEPSNADIEGALVENMGNMGKKGPGESISKIGCKEDGKNAYRCDVEIKKGSEGKVIPLRFVKTDSGWRMTP